MFLASTPRLIRKCFSKELIWSVEKEQASAFLTFDDGPNPQTSFEILETLDKFKVPATFFCLGKNCEQNPSLFDAIKKAGHTVGNHTYSHLNGWKTHSKNYISDIERSNNIIASPLFRPPYGRIKPSQINILKNKYRIYMWSVLTGDFDPELPADRCLQYSVRFARPGSIIVFHDSEKAFSKVKTVLPEFLKQVADTGISFKAL